MKISIIIPAYNEEKYLKSTLEKIRIGLNSVSNQFEVIVVNNNSEDKTAEIAINSGARVVNESIHNIGKVRNTGAKSASGDVFIFIDADTLVPEELFQQIADIMQDKKCFGGAVAVAYEEFQRKWMKYYLLGWKFWGEVFNMKQGAAQFCRKTAFKELSGYDESIFMGEDIEFYWRLSKFARQNNGYLHFIENPKVITSSRRFDRMNLLKTFFLTHPLIIWLNWKRKSVWKDWYEKAIR
ncbi:MAG: glycosyltransferase [Acidobacteriota bacterium]|nr:glycosyltransferase [Acidobacteriota bacterium]